MDELIKLFESGLLVAPALITIISGFVIVASHAIIGNFEIKNKYIKTVIPLLISAYIVIAFIVFKDNDIMLVINTILAIYAGSTGLFNGFKQKKSNEDYQAEIYNIDEDK